MTINIVIEPVITKAQKKAFIALAYQINADDPHWVPPLKTEMRALLDPKKNPFFDHATVQLLLAREGGKLVGRISAHIDHLALEQPLEQGMGPGTGNWGLLEADSEAAATTLIGAAEDWLKDKGMRRVLAPLSLSVWDEPGLLTKGHDHPPTIMMGHNKADYQGWIENAGYKTAKHLYTYRLTVQDGFTPLIARIVKSGQRNSKINIRPVDKKNFDRDAKIIMDILNDAWSQNWGFVPLTDREIDHVGKKLKAIVHEQLIMIAEFEDKPVAFMMTLPNINEAIQNMGGNLLPFNWAKLLWWLRNPKSQTMRVPLMGVRKDLQNSRLTSQLAFMMIEQIRINATRDFGTEAAEMGWILEDNQGMVSVAEAIDADINKVYTLYDKAI